MCLIIKKNTFTYYDYFNVSNPDIIFSGKYKVVLIYIFNLKVRREAFDLFL